MLNFIKLKILMNGEDCLAIEPVKGYLLSLNDYFIDIGIQESLLNAQISTHYS